MSVGAKRAVMVRSSVAEGTDVFSCKVAPPVKAAPAAVASTRNASQAWCRCFMVVALLRCPDPVPDLE
jgi:hypothetical protein